MDVFAEILREDGRHSARWRRSAVNDSASNWRVNGYGGEREEGGKSDVRPWLRSQIEIVTKWAPLTGQEVTVYDVSVLPSPSSLHLLAPLIDRTLPLPSALGVRGWDRVTSTFPLHWSCTLTVVVY